MGLFLALCAFNANARTDSMADGLSVADRPRPAYDPAGLRAGGFMVLPSIDVGISIDDNIYRTRRGEIRDTVRSLRPQLFVTSDWRNHRLELNTGLDASSFADAEDEDVTNWFANAAGRLDISRDSWIRAGLGLRELHEERGDPNTPSIAVRPVSREILSANAEWFQRFNRLSLAVEGSYADLGYDDSVTAAGQRLIQNDRDRSETEVSAKASWELTSGYQAFLRGTRYIRRYDRLQGVELYDRDSDGAEVAAGARLELGAVLAGELFLGRRRQSYDNDGRLPEVEGTSYGGALTWNVTPLTTIRAAASRTIGESTLRQASGYLASSLQLSADHELFRCLLIGVLVNRSTNQYQGIDRKDDIVTGLVRGTWLISRNLQMDFGYRSQQRSSTTERDDYKKNLVFLNVRVRY